MDVDINVALEEADAAVHYGDSLGPTFAAVLAAEVRSLHEQLDTCRRSRDGWQDAVKRLRDERARMGTLPFEAAFLIEGEPEQLIFRGPAGQVVLRRMRDGESS